MPRTFFFAFDGSPPIATVAPRQFGPMSEEVEHLRARKLTEFIDSMKNNGARS